MATPIPPPPPPPAAADTVVDYFNLPCPIPFEELHREAMSKFLSQYFPAQFYFYQFVTLSFLCCFSTVSLKPDLFEGMRFDFTKMLNQKFTLNHRFVRLFFFFLSIFIFVKLSFVKPIWCCVISVLMGPTEIPSQSTETIKIPTAHYEFGSTFIDHPRVIRVSFKWPFFLYGVF